jgi:hypothetical protein
MIISRPHHHNPVLKLVNLICPTIRAVRYPTTSSDAKQPCDTPPHQVVLAYSGGLDTSIILKWLQDTYGCEVITFTADLGRGLRLHCAPQG